MEHRGKMGDLGIGDRLRNAREAKGLSLEAVEGLTRIRAAYLRAMEDEEFERLPGPAYLKGFLRTYAAALGLDPDPLVEAVPVEQPQAPSLIGMRGVEIPIQPAAPRSPLRRAATYTGLALVVGAIALGAVGYLQLRQFNAPLPPEAVTPVPPEPTPGTPEPLQPAPAVPEPPPEPTDGPEKPAPETGGVTLEIRATGESWIRVTADGETAFQGVVEAGTVRRWRAEERLTLRVGNAPALEILVNGESVTPGRQVWEQTFEAP